ncbi:MAG: argininosuccinate synthase [Candidatus Altiarchaeales archaeon WOR_SM1_86-2]|nr:MAG: argininosuccinate synthase [Candidatus Altiarchaeales archaeon WOR_SM1_86-2]ODS38300.1 MAG: argininosuccinate synthase [Candidatus Altiarchaeales archaeon WOR_SM1_79]
MKVVLAYSGGLDTSVAIKWLQDKGHDVVTFTAELGQNENLGEIKKKAESIGAKSYIKDLRREFVNDYVFPAIKANALYEGVYPLGTALARPLIAKHLVKIAEKENASAVAHGCTGKGNDKVRFEVTIKALNENLNIISPMVELGLSREEEIEYAKKHGIPVPVKKESPYSVDENLWGRSVECGILEHPEEEPPEDAFEWTSGIENTPDKAERIEIEFKSGVPSKLNNDAMDGVSLVSKLNEIAGKHGVGRLDHMEDRIIGLKTREVYEAPAAVVLLSAHNDLQKLCLTANENLFREVVERKWAYLAYSGLWMDPLREDLQAFIDKVNEKVTGSVKIKLHKGSCRVVGRKSENAIYDLNLATYGKKDVFDQKASDGFTELWGLQSRIARKIRKRKT